MKSMAAYRALVARLEDEARERPGRYKAKLAALAAFGFGFLGLAVILGAGTAIGLILLLIHQPILLLKLIKVIWIPAAFAWVILRSLWVRFDPPEGHTLAPGEAQALRIEVERLRLEAGAPPLSAIVIDSDLNAAAVTLPRMAGLLGYRHVLLLGLPLMQALSPDEFRSVVAHEFGHFGGRHGRFTGWIYRVRLGWYRVLAVMTARRSWSTGLFRRFFEWYAPYFNAYSFVLARSNEYAADAIAARVTNPEVAGTALVRIHLSGERLNEAFWPGIVRRNREQPSPPAALYRELANCMRATHEPAAGALDRLLARPSDPDDTHPSLAQRLEALGAVLPDGLPQPIATSAADAFLGPLQPMLEEQFSQRWHENVRDGWSQRHEEAKRQADRFDELEWKDARTPEEEVEHAELVRTLHPDLDGLANWQRVAGIAPNSALAQFRLGEAMLERDDPTGEACLRRAIELDPDAQEAALQVLDAFHRRRGEDAGLDQVGDEMRGLQRRRIAQARKRLEIGSRPRFLAHGLPQDALSALEESAATVDKLDKLWLVRQDIGEPDGLPHFVGFVQFKGLVVDESALLRKTVDALQVPGSLLIVTKSNGAWRAIRKAAGGPTWRR